jgi:hypothetical protein
MPIEICPTTSKFVHLTYAKTLAHLRGLQAKYTYRGGEVFR